MKKSMTTRSKRGRDNKDSLFQSSSIFFLSKSAMRPWLALARATRFAARRSQCSAPPPLTVGRSVARTEDGARWVASIDVDGTAYRIGEFDTEDAATLAWDEWNALVASVDEQSSSVVAAAPLSEAWSPPAKAEEEEEEEEDAAWDALHSRVRS